MMMRVHLPLFSRTRVTSSQATDLGFARTDALILVVSAHDQVHEVCRGQHWSERRRLPFAADAHYRLVDRVHPDLSLDDCLSHRQQ